MNRDFKGPNGARTKRKPVLSPFCPFSLASIKSCIPSLKSLILQLMRDIIWTLIVIWLVFKIVNIIKNNFGKAPNNVRDTASPKKEAKQVIKDHLNKEGEYVDFEEIK
jgi:hypothetical protein